MTIAHFEFLVEEYSMEEFLISWLPTHLPGHISFKIISFQGKMDLLSKADARLRAYSRWIPSDWAIILIVDRDNQDCGLLKVKLEQICAAANLATRRISPVGWRAATCIAIEELEAWYFGDWTAVISAYPKVSPYVRSNARYRQSDAVEGGTWEAFEQVLQRAGYFAGGLQKVSAAREVGKHIAASRSNSASFLYLTKVLNEACNSA